MLFSSFISSSLLFSSSVDILFAIAVVFCVSFELLVIAFIVISFPSFGRILSQSKSLISSNVHFPLSSPFISYITKPPPIVFSPGTLDAENPFGIGTIFSLPSSSVVVIHVTRSESSPACDGIPALFASCILLLTSLFLKYVSIAFVPSIVVNSSIAVIDSFSLFNFLGLTVCVFLLDLTAFAFLLDLTAFVFLLDLTVFVFLFKEFLSINSL